MSGAEKEQGSSSRAAFNRCVRMRQVCEMTGMSKASVYRKMADGTFPHSFKIGESMSAWRVATIEAWIADKERA
jgi:prophage regulatory protein